MANLGYTNTPLIAHLYDTSEAALAAASELGCNGYRTYNINGQNKYVPCSSFMAYEKAIQLYKIQGTNNVITGDNTLGDNAVGLQFASSKNEIGGDPYFTLGNFSINKSITQKEVIEGKQAEYVGGDVSYTSESINENNPSKNNETSAVSQVNKKIDNNLTVKVLFDKKKLENYVLYSPLKDVIKNSVIEITRNFPASIALDVIGIQSPVASEYNYSERTDTAQLKVNLANISNPFDIEYTSSGTTINDQVNVAPIRNFSKKHKEYVLYYNKVEYPIINATLPSSYDDDDTGIYLTIEGDPFSSVVNQNLTLNRKFWIKPKRQEYDEFYTKLSDMGRFLLDYDYDKEKYISTIRYSKVDDNGVNLNVNEKLIFPQIDEVNIDLFSNDFDSYLTKLNGISDDFDSTKTNLISRFLTTDSLKEFDTEDRRFNLILGLMGKNFDNVRKYIDGITYMTNLSYDKIENIPDLLTKNYGNMLGFETYNVEDEGTIMESLFSLEDLNVESGVTPAEIDIELWRRIFINSYHLWKSKGTRKSIEFILNLVGLPDSIFEINEHVYVARQKLNFEDKARDIYGYKYSDEVLLTLLPIDRDGHPTVPGQVQYQESGFNLSNDGKNYGPYDFGNAYIKAYEYEGKTPLFNLDRRVDNVKSWVYSEDKVLRLSEDSVGYTEYYEDDSRLVINSKELEVFLSSDKIFDFTIYRLLNRSNTSVNSDLTFPYDKEVNVGELTFNEFVQKSLDEFIKPDNRKTIKTYPTLSKIYYDYAKLTNTPVTNTKSLEFLNKFDGSWVKLVQQFAPATSILNAGKKIQNSKFIDNKFVYKHGLNDDLGWLGNDGSEFQNKAQKPVSNGTTNPFSTTGKGKDAIIGETPTFSIKGKKGLNYTGYDPSINEYFGFYYSIEDACNTTVKVYDWDGTENYGDDTIYNGNINVSGGTKGVFVKYDNTLYRLNTNRMFTGILPTINTKVSHRSDYISLDNVNDTETILLPNGAGEYVIKFDIKGVDQLKIYDGTASGTLLTTIGGTTNAFITTVPEYDYHNEFTFSSNQITILRTTNLNRNTEITKLNIDLKHGTPLNLKVNNQLVYQPISFGVDSHTVAFNDSPIIVNPTERNYYIECIGIGHTDLANDIDYICPLPKPHVCYFDYSGLTINMSGLGYTTTNYSTYLDETDKELSIKQPIYHGYSLDTAITEPSNAINGTAGNWVIPFTKNNIWTDGELYYKDDIIKHGSVYYIVDDISVTGTTTTPTGVTTTTIIPGMYQSYMSRTKTDPYMHLSPALINKKRIDALKDVISFNLTKDLYLYQVFSGATSNETYKVTDNILNDELYISDSSTLTFDGFYSLNDENVGPFYLPKEEEILTQTLEETLTLTPDQTNFINIKSLNDNFDVDNNQIGLGDGFYLVKSNSYLKFESDLYFESDQTATQNVIIRLQDQFNEIIHEQIFSFSGSDEPQDRIANIITESLFKVDTRLYLTIYPETIGCRLSRYEKIEIDYTNPTTYSAIDDPRFRVGFNAGRTILDGHYVEDAMSIEPVGDDNNYDVDHYMFRVNSNTDTYKFRPKLNVAQTYDEDKNFGLIFGKYYNKYKTNSTIGDVTSYEKKYNNDKIDFEFKVRSKNISAVSNLNQSYQGITTTHTITSSNNYLGNTPQELENTGLSKSIIFGKTPEPRSIKLNKPNFPFLSSYLNDSIISPTGSTIDFKGYDEGLADYDLIDYSGNIKTSFLSKSRYKSITGYWKKENAVYQTELYQDILSVVPEFSENINNYSINDIVKVTLLNTDIVIEGDDGTTTIENKNVDRLYVCIEDITIDHLRKESGGVTNLNIHPIYQPNGARSCFIPIERYDIKSFKPSGYDKHQKNGIVRTNHKPYTYEEAKILTGTISDTLDLGDIIKTPGTGSTYTLIEYVYNKPLTYDPTKEYKLGSFVLHKNGSTSTDYNFWLKIDESANNEPGTEVIGGAGVISWMKLNPTGSTLNQNSNDKISGSDINTYLTGHLYQWNSTQVTEWDNLDISSASLRIPNLLPTKSGGVGYAYNNHLTPYTGNDKIVSDMVPNYIDIPTLTNNQLDGVDNIGQLTSNGMVFFEYTGTTGSIYTGYTMDTNLIQNDYTDLISGNSNNNNIQLNQDKTNNNISNLFDLLCSDQNDSSIYEYSNTKVYNSSSLYNNEKYVLDRNVLYKTKSSGVLTNKPHTDTTNWDELDFMLVSKYTLYKDRTSIKIYDGEVVSLDEATKNDLYFFDNNLVIRDAFTETSFSGTTHDTKLINGLNKLYDAKNDNLRDSYSYGLTGFRKSGSDLIMDYYYERDENNLPKTGEFIGGLTITNPCGHNAKVIFGTLFDFNEKQVDDIFGRIQTAPPTPSELSSTNNPVVRLIINQAGSSQVTLKTIDNNGYTTAKTINSNSSVDDTLFIQEGGNIQISVEYDIFKNATRYKNGVADEYVLFDDNDKGISNTFVKADKTSVGGVETRTITLKDMYEDRVVKLDFEGANFIELSTVDPNDFIVL